MRLPGSGPASDPTGTVLAVGLAALLVGSGVLHFVRPEPFASIVPRVLPAPTALVYASGVAELACAGGLLLPATRRRAGWATAVLFVAVFPANLQMALDGGARGADGLLGSAAVAWLRLPLQVPLVLAGIRVARGRGGWSPRRRRA